MLMEVYFATPFELLAKKYGVATEEGSSHGSSGGLRYLDANVVFQACKSEIPENSQFHYSVEKCLDPTIWEDDEQGRLNNETLSLKIYQEVVQPLETELSQAYSTIPIEDLDRFAQSLDLANWDQTIQEWDSRSLIDSVSDISQAQQFTSSPSPGAMSPSPYSSHQRSPEAQAPVHNLHPLLYCQRPAAQHYAVPTPRSITPDGVDYKASEFFDDETLSATHSNQALSSYLQWRSRYQQVYEKFIPDDSSETPVKVAILDTGIDLNHPDIQARAENIKGKYNWLNEKHSHAVHDRNGHGTFVPSLLLDYAPDAELYVAKIADTKPSDPNVIAQITYMISE